MSAKYSVKITKDNHAQICRAIGRIQQATGKKESIEKYVNMVLSEHLKHLP